MYGAYPAGPQRLDTRDPQALSSAQFGEVSVTGQDAVFADADGSYTFRQHLRSIGGVMEE